MSPAPAPTDVWWFCPTKACPYITHQPRTVSAVAHVCRMNRDHQTALRRAADRADALLKEPLRT